MTFAFAALAAQETAAEVQGNLLAELLILFGCIFLLAAAVGVFPLSRLLHPPPRLDQARDPGRAGYFYRRGGRLCPQQLTARVLLIAAFFFLTAPLSGYMIARSGYLRGLEPYREDTSVDEWGACGSAENPLKEEARGVPGRTS